MLASTNNNVLGGLR